MPTKVNSSFSKTNPNLQVAWDATSLSSFMTCPRKYQYEIIRGLRRGGTHHHLEFGTLFHAALDEFDLARGAGKSKAEATMIAFDKALDSTWDQEKDLPWDTGDNKKNRFTLVRAVLWYCDEQQEEGGVEPYVFPNGRVAVELSFRVPLPRKAPTGEQYLLCGHLDGMVRWGDEVFIKERKTTGTTLGLSYFRGFAPNIQVDTYGLAGWMQFPDMKISGVMLEATQTAVGFARFQRQPFYQTPARREEWLGEMLDAIAEAEACAVKGHWPRRTSSCNLYGGCPFRSICSLDPGKREMFLTSGDYTEQPWDPLKAR